MSTVEHVASRWDGRLVEALVARRAITEAEGREALSAAEGERVHVSVVLARRGRVHPLSSAQCLSAISGLAYVDLDAEPPDPEVAALLPPALAGRLSILPYRRDGERLVLACSEPPDADAVRSVAAATGSAVGQCVLVDPGQLARHVAGGAPAEGPVGAPGAPAGQRAAVPEEPPARSLQGAAGAAPHRARPLPGGPDELAVSELLAHAVANGASDLHLTDRFPPAIRVDGSIRPIEGLERLSGEQIRRMVFAILPKQLIERFEETRELDTSYSVRGLGRFRVNVFLQRGMVGAVLRLIPDDIPALDSLGLPPAVAGLAELRKGLVLLTGPTGSGKSTTLAALTDVINQSKPLHIMTVEDPIEYVHHHGHSIVNQREVGQDTRSFAESLRHVLRQDPDVILVGEMRDLETISTALTAAETGHLVFATLHTQDAPQSIDRMIDVFPSEQQEQVRIQLAGALEAVVTQQLIPAFSGTGRVVVAEVMICTPGIRNLIRSAKTYQVYSLMQTGAAMGMQTMDQALALAVREQRISRDMAMDRSRDPKQLADYLGGAPLHGTPIEREKVG